MNSFHRLLFRSLFALSFAASPSLLAAGELPEIELTVFDAIRSALENNLQLQVEELSPGIASEGIRQARGAFDPVFSVEGMREYSDRRQNTLEFLSTSTSGRRFEEDNRLLRAGVAQKLPFGTVVDFNTRLRRVTNTAIDERFPILAPFNPEYQAFAGFDITQPLLRDSGLDTNLAGIRAARLNLSIAEEEREILVVNVISEVINTYYDMVFGQENLRVKQEALSVAEELLRGNRRRLELGRMAPIDVAEAEVSVSLAQEEVIQAKDFLRERELRLRRFIYERTDFADGVRLRAVEELPEEPDAPEDPHALYLGALELRPDYRLAEAQLRRERVRESFTENQALPRLDLKFSFGFTGLEDSFASSYDRVFNVREPQWAAGFVFSAPIGNREGRARHNAVRLQRRQAEIDLQRVEHEIALDVQNAVSRLETIGQRLATARESVRLAEEAARIEETRLEAGRTTSYRVLELQTAVADARTRELAARADGQKALSQVWAVSGRLLMEHGFYLADYPRPVSLPERPRFLTPAPSIRR